MTDLPNEKVKKMKQQTEEFPSAKQMKLQTEEINFKNCQRDIQDATNEGKTYSWCFFVAQTDIKRLTDKGYNVRSFSKGGVIVDWSK